MQNDALMERVPNKDVTELDAVHGIKTNTWDSAASLDGYAGELLADAVKIDDERKIVIFDVNTDEIEFYLLAAVGEQRTLGRNEVEFLL